MKFRGLIAAAGVLLAALQMPLGAVADTAEPEKITPIYEPDRPIAGQLDVSFVSDTAPIMMEVYQHSPERENLLYCTYNFADAKQGSAWRVELEPGSYTVQMTARLLKDGSMKQTFKQDFEIADPDENADVRYSYTTYEMTVSETAIADTEESGKHTGELKSEDTTEGLRELCQTVSFDYYDRLRGDFDGDGAITAVDATKTLIESGNAMIGNPYEELTPGKLAACDMNHNGIPDVKDTMAILRYFGEKNAGREPVWED